MNGIFKNHTAFKTTTTTKKNNNYTFKLDLEFCLFYNAINRNLFLERHICN